MNLVWKGRLVMDLNVEKALQEWKKEIYSTLDGIDKQYEETRSELQVYNYKYNITKQVVQSTMNEEMIRNIREQYQKPFEKKYNELKESIKDLEEKKKVYQMFIDKIDRVLEKGEDSSKISFSE
jgi:vacuolar-type H+-ATPase subunit E/Vma4